MDMIELHPDDLSPARIASLHLDNEHVLIALAKAVRIHLTATGATAGGECLWTATPCDPIHGARMRAPSYTGPYDLVAHYVRGYATSWAAFRDAVRTKVEETCGHIRRQFAPRDA